MGKLRCKWVRDRLPLLVGDELRGLDRRGVERHLIGCPQCREHQAALGQALGALRSVAAISPAAPDAPSLWPALARQIRESRRPSPTPAFAWSLPLPFASALSWPRANPWPALGLGLSLGLLATIGVGFGVRQKISAAQSHVAAQPLPLAPAAVEAPRPRLVMAPAPQSRPQPSREQPPPAADATTVEIPPAPTRVEYDLEHLRPMSPDTRDARDSKFTH
jgi:anti-sigma factor RsiW